MPPGANRERALAPEGLVVYFFLTCGIFGSIVAGGDVITPSARKGIRPVSGAVGTPVGRDGSLLRRRGVRGLCFRLRSGLGTFALVVIVAGPARVRLFALATKFGAHRNPLAYREVRSNGLMLLPSDPGGCDLRHK